MLLQVYNVTYATAHRSSVTVMRKQNAIAAVFADVQIQRFEINMRSLFRISIT